MNIQKSRLMAMFTVMLMVCMMVSMLVVPASAATSEVAVYHAITLQRSVAAAILEALNADLQQAVDYETLALGMGAGGSIQLPASQNGEYIYVNSAFVSGVVSRYNEMFHAHLEFPENPRTYYTQGDTTYYRFEYSGQFQALGSAPTGNPLIYHTSSAFVNAIPDNSISAVFNQILDLLPIVIPVLIGFIGLNKAIQFITGVLHSA